MSLLSWVGWYDTDRTMISGFLALISVDRRSTHNATAHLCMFYANFKLKGAFPVQYLQRIKVSCSLRILISVRAVGAKELKCKQTTRVK